MNFDDWMHGVDRLFAAEFGGLDSGCFPDYMWWAAYSEGLSQKEAFGCWYEDVYMMEDF